MNNPHKNARTCLYSREQIVLRHQNGEGAAEIGAAFGISVRTVYKWLRRYREEGTVGLHQRSSAPRMCAQAYISGWRKLICKLRRLRLTALEISGLLNIPRSTIAHALKA